MLRRFRFAAVLWSLLATAAFAAVVATPVFVQFPNNGKAQIINGSGFYVIAADGASVTNTVLLYTCETTNGAASKIVSITASSNDTVARDVTVFLINASKAYPITTVTLPINAGTSAATAPVALMTPITMPGYPLDSDGNPYLTCVTGDTIRVGVPTAVVTATKVISVIAVAADY